MDSDEVWSFELLPLLDVVDLWLAAGVSVAWRRRVIAYVEDRLRKEGWMRRLEDMDRDDCLCPFKTIPLFSEAAYWNEGGGVNMPLVGHLMMHWGDPTGRFEPPRPSDEGMPPLEKTRNAWCTTFFRFTLSAAWLEYAGDTMIAYALRRTDPRSVSLNLMEWFRCEAPHYPIDHTLAVLAWFHGHPSVNPYRWIDNALPFGGRHGVVYFADHTERDVNVYVMALATGLMPVVHAFALKSYTMPEFRVCRAVCLWAQHPTAFDFVNASQTFANIPGLAWQTPKPNEWYLALDAPTPDLMERLWVEEETAHGDAPHFPGFADVLYHCITPLAWTRALEWYVYVPMVNHVELTVLHEILLRQFLSHVLHYVRGVRVYAAPPLTVLLQWAKTQGLLLQDDMSTLVSRLLAQIFAPGTDHAAEGCTCPLHQVLEAMRQVGLTGCRPTQHALGYPGANNVRVRNAEALNARGRHIGGIDWFRRALEEERIDPDI